MSQFTKDELYEINDAIVEVITRMCERGQTEMEVKEQSLRQLQTAQKKVTVMLLGTDDTPGIRNTEPKVLDAIKNPKLLSEAQFRRRIK